MIFKIASKFPDTEVNAIGIQAERRVGQSRKLSVEKEVRNRGLTCPVNFFFCGGQLRLTVLLSFDRCSPIPLHLAPPSSHPTLIFFFFFSLSGHSTPHFCLFWTNRSDNTTLVHFHWFSNLPSHHSIFFLSSLDARASLSDFGSTAHVLG